ncbi:putative bifunctional diguanylate cyclase/phosphodiesterase [Rhodoferax sp.]|uniref:putative bifunctional diguanylate cyclase/phosphodiesterase n=1 Tax=Rhodoferax sp. TaxID=50421 RepID=UPI00374D685D
MKNARLYTFFRSALARLPKSDAPQAPRRRQNNEAELARKMELLMCTATDGLHILDHQGQLLEASEAFRRMLGYSQSEVLDLNVSAWDEKWDREALAQQLANSRDQAVVFESQHRRKDGSLLDVEIYVAGASFDGHDYICAASRDISERKRTEQELRIAATAFEAHEAMYITDSDRVILRVNQAFTQSSGYRADEVVGQLPKLLRSGDHPAAFYEDMWQQIETQGYWHGEMTTRRKNGERYPIWFTLTAVKGADGRISNYVGTQTDISYRRAAEEEIIELAFYDALTKLGNRRLLLDRLQQALAVSSRNGTHGGLLFIDLDNFKTLNDTAGHEMGDLLLQQVAQRLGTCVRPGDTVARLGGDEFVVILADLGCKIGNAAHQAEQVGERILATLNAPYDLAGQSHYSSPSIGVALFGAEDSSVAELLRRADLAMYQAKAGGRNGLRFFDPAMQTAITARADIESALRLALQRQEFVLHYQPQVSRDGKLMGAEALVRWQHPQRGMLAPGAFISTAEDSGLIIPLGLQVLEIACLQLVAWAGDSAMCEFPISVNVSARQFHQRDFVAQVLGTLQRTGARPRQLKLELTESLLLDNVEDTIAKMTELRAHGVGFSLDDFGIGYSSLSYLKRLPLDQLKIDQSFVHGVLRDPNDAAIAQMIVALGQSMGLSVIAEGVETEEQRIFLAGCGCHGYQGYLFGRPMPAPQFEAFVQGTECAPSGTAATAAPAPQARAVAARTPASALL